MVPVLVIDEQRACGGAKSSHSRQEAETKRRLRRQDSYAHVRNIPPPSDPLSSTQPHS